MKEKELYPVCVVSLYRNETLKSSFSSNREPPLHIIPFDIVRDAFTFWWDNLSENSLLLFLNGKTRYTQTTTSLRVKKNMNLKQTWLSYFFLL